MVYLIPKACMHPIERYAVLAGLILAGAGVGFAATLIPDGHVLATAVSLACVLALVLNPADRLEYRVEPEGLRVGRLHLPFAAMAGVRLVRLDRTIVYAGLVLPGYWGGRAWAPGLGRFRILGSTGLGQGLLITMQDGQRIVITPAHAVRVLVQLQVLLTTLRAAAQERGRVLRLVRK